MDSPRNPTGIPLRTVLPPGLDARSAAVLREIVEQYVETGEPVGSRTLSRRLPMSLSPATIRNVMADLTDAGLLFAPHTSAGRLPTDQGLRLFVDGLLHFGELAEDEREAISAALAASGRSLEDTLAEAELHALRPVPRPPVSCSRRNRKGRPAYRVRAARTRPRARRAGQRRRPCREPGDRDPAGPAALRVAAGQQLPQRAPLRPLARRTAPIVADEMAANRTELDTLSAKVVEAGLATWTGEGRAGQPDCPRPGAPAFGLTQIERLTAIQALFERLEAQETMLRLLELAEQSEGVRIFIGAESGLFGTSGVSMVVAPARNEGGRIVGAIGVIGPTRINYGRIIPVVDYTARVIGRLLG